MVSTRNQFLRTFVFVAIFAYLLGPESTEARSLEDQRDENLGYNQANNQQLQQQQYEAALAAAAAAQRPILSEDDANNLDRFDTDDDDDDDDRVQQVMPDLQQQQQPSMASGGAVAGGNNYQTDQSYQPAYQQSATQDLGTAASKHYGHHKHGAKGWLDMGAWTGKKGAFGWYDKHPVGKGKMSEGAYNDDVDLA